MIVDAALWTFIVFVGAIVSTYLLYPAVLLIYGKTLRAVRADAHDQSLASPKISVIICAHNEEAVIGDKLRSIAEQNWDGNIEVIVANDGSSDRTAEIASSFESTFQHIKVLNFNRNGKWFALNKAVEYASGDILIFSDADTIWIESALRELVRPFSDSSIGCVAGNIVSRKSQSSAAAGFDRLFRTYESTIRSSEEHLAGCISADGGLFAIRAALFEPVPPGVTDDFFISTGTVLRGQKIVFADKAIALEYAIANEKKNLRRRIRITVRGLTSLFKRRALLNPFKFGFYSLSLFFHKFLRRLSAVLIVLLFPLSLILVYESWFFGLLAAGQAVLYFSAILSLAGGKPLPGIGKLSLAAIHVIGLAVGFMMFVFGKRFDRWSPSRAS